MKKCGNACIVIYLSVRKAVGKREKARQSKIRSGSPEKIIWDRHARTWGIWLAHVSIDSPMGRPKNNQQSMGRHARVYVEVDAG